MLLPERVPESGKIPSKPTAAWEETPHPEFVCKHLKLQSLCLSLWHL